MNNEIYNLSEEHDSVLDNRFCECGGHLSRIAKPKCIYCDIEIFDSFFNYTDDAPNYDDFTMPIRDRLKILFWWVPFGHVPEINALGLKESLAGDNPPQIIDVRSSTEWQRSRIPDAVNVPIQNLRKSMESLRLDTERPVVTICLSAHRSIPAVRLLQAKGFKNVVQLKGGMLAWWKENYRTEGTD